MKLSDLVEVNHLVSQRLVLQKAYKAGLTNVKILIAGNELNFNSDEALDKFKEIISEELHAVEESLAEFGVELEPTADNK